MILELSNADVPQRVIHPRFIVKTDTFRRCDGSVALGSTFRWSWMGFAVKTSRCVLCREDKDLFIAGLETRPLTSYS
ncbi:uncharacterized protein ARMOST_17930 [Armillaria ostoyae]|uniref:Uncharacterized protein n=1 Tax=Armillaria ostoyae TaxID=47428 RepID=A0A284S0D9_ARMOS|nr:uncharacterized protein ARMOST_17930 [Armillaria ostoyae]